MSEEKKKIDLKPLLVDSRSAVASDDSKFDLTDRFSTGLHSLDLIIGGGLYAGRLVEFSAEKSTGKSTLLDNIRASFQRIYGGVCVHAESESTMDMTRAMLMGVDPELVVLPSSPIEVLEDGFEWLKSQGMRIKEVYPDVPILFSWDTIEATVTRDQYNSGGGVKKTKEMNMHEGGRQQFPRVLKFKLKEFIPMLSNMRAAAILLNQVYDGGGFGDDDLTAPGGHGLNHFVSLHLRFKRQGLIYNNEVQLMPVGVNVKIKAIKNKQGPEKLDIEIPLFYDSGFCDELAIYRLALRYGILKQSSNGWISGNEPYGKPVSLRSSELGRKGERIKGSPFFYWMTSGLYRWYAYNYPSLAERYTEIAEELDDKALKMLGEGIPVINDKSSTEVVPFIYK